MRTAAICFCLCLVANQVSAQAQQSDLGRLSATGIVRGKDGSPQPGVPLTVEGPIGRTLVFTDGSGKWSLYNLAPGSYSIQPAWKSPANSPPRSFSVEKRSVIDRLTRDSSVYEAPVITIDKAPPNLVPNVERNPL